MALGLQSPFFEPSREDSQSPLCAPCLDERRPYTHTHTHTQTKTHTYTDTDSEIVRTSKTIPLQNWRTGTYTILPSTVCRVFGVKMLVCSRNPALPVSQTIILVLRALFIFSRHCSLVIVHVSFRLRRLHYSSVQQRVENIFIGRSHAE